jgi:hypothetical protein
VVRSHAHAHRPTSDKTHRPGRRQWVRRAREDVNIEASCGVLCAIPNHLLCRGGISQGITCCNIIKLPTQPTNQFKNPPKNVGPVIDAREVLDLRPGIKPGVRRDRFRRLDGRSDDSEIYTNQKPGGTLALKSGVLNDSRMGFPWVLYNPKGFPS